MLHPKHSTEYFAINDESDESKLKVIPISGIYMHLEVYCVYFEEKSILIYMGGVT